MATRANMQHWCQRIFWCVWLLRLLDLELVSCCENGWTPYPPAKACFKLFNDIKRDWGDAKTFCAGKGAYLTDMYNTAEQKFINESVLKGINISHGVWLGATDEHWKKNGFRWVIGTKMNIHLFEWREDNPDNGYAILSGGEDCLEMTTEHGYRGLLNDYYCYKELPFVCKNKQMYTETTTPLMKTSTKLHSLGQTSLPEQPGNSQTPVIVILASLLIIAVAVTTILIVKRRKKNPTLTNVYIDTAELAHNEHVLTVLPGTSGIVNGASTSRRPRMKTPPVSQSLERQYSLPNPYDRIIENSDSSGIVNGASTSRRPRMETPPVSQSLERQYSRPKPYDRIMENSDSGSQTTGQNSTCLKPESCRPHEHIGRSTSVDGNPSEAEVPKRQNKGVKGQQLVLTPSGYLDMENHYLDLLNDNAIFPHPDSLREKKGNGKEADDESYYVPPSVYVMP